MSTEPTGPQAERWTPSWVKLLGMPVWVTGPDGRISYANGRTEALLGRSLDRIVGSPCYRVISGRTPGGSPFCKPDCHVHRLARRDHEIEPVTIHVPTDGNRTQEIRVVVIVAHPPDGDTPYFVHCVVDTAREARFHRYLTRVVARSTPRRTRAATGLERAHLTERENQVLRLLSEDETLHGIAHRLDLSYATVRNHVQHILNKLGVHSILEAVAFYLLIDE